MDTFTTLQSLSSDESATVSALPIATSVEEVYAIPMEFEHQGSGGPGWFCTIA
ncbi:fungal mating-type pheromone [Serpula lacrymans var. lacrymans S7.3]|uniref:Fungal mating-type pheromone n=1 Tax=Serpula lacrymans var. lacrymans (strain S7.3) TaxID=936435 RepID=F8QGC9_SERL3|nr:fungal mating-type pheromone [Serpula lacrymans var. lacrymans S7.3]